MFRIFNFTLLLLVCVSATAEPLSHKNAEVGYRDGHWSLNVERPINNNFYITGFGNYSDEVKTKLDQRAKVKILGGGVRNITFIDEATQFYSGLDLVQSNIAVNATSNLKDGSYFYPGVVAGFKVSQVDYFEWDLRASHYFSNNSVEYDYVDTTSFSVTGRYFIDPAMSIGFGYVWLKESDSISLDNLAFSFALYFE